MASTQNPPLPPDADGQAHVTVHAILAGGLWLPYKEVFQDSLNEPTEVGSEIPFIAFLISHPTYGRTLFDLGLRKVGNIAATDIKGAERILSARKGVAACRKGSA
jgi:hypothetical protein